MSNDPYKNPRTQNDPVGPQSPSPSASTLKSHARTSQVIRLALVVGVMVIAATLSFTQTPNEDLDELVFLFVGGALWLSTFVASFIVPALMTKGIEVSCSDESFDSHGLTQQVRQMDPEETVPWEVRQLMGIYATNKLVQAALLEGSCIINLVFWSLGGSILHLLMVGINVLVMLATCPTIQSLRDYLVHGIECSLDKQQ